MDEQRFDCWTRGLEDRLTRRGLGGIAAAAFAVRGVAVTAEAKKKKKKKKKKPSGTACVFPYFACDGECRLEPACCDSIPAKNCASLHAGQGGDWVCCTHAGFGCYDLDNDKLNCNACGHACDANQHCLNGTCLD